jgi:hypothetical protein
MDVEMYIYCMSLFKHIGVSCRRLKVLTNEKRGGLTVESFDRSRFKGTVS